MRTWTCVALLAALAVPLHAELMIVDVAGGDGPAAAREAAADFKEVADIVRIDVADGMLQPTLPNGMEVSGTPKLKDLPGRTRVQVYRSGGDARNLILEHTAEPNAAGHSQKAVISVTPQVLSMHHSVPRAEHMLDVRLTQNMLDRGSAAQNAQKGFVTLVVVERELDSAPGKAGKSVANLRADNFVALWTAHPEEVDRYVVPMFKMMHLWGVFDLRPDELLQVYGGNAVDKDAAAAVAALLPELDADDRAVRDAAGEKLRKLGRAGALAATALDGTKLTPEQRTRIKSVAVEFLPLSPEEVAARRKDKGFTLRAMAAADAEVARAAHRQYEVLAGEKVAFNPEDPQEARRKQILPLLRDALRARGAAATGR